MTDVSVVEMTWWLPPSVVNSSPSRIVAALTSSFPSARPVRFGLGDPPPSTMETDGPDKFAAEWRDRLELGYFTQWTGRPPIFRVSVGFPDRRTDVEPGFRSATLACYLDADYATRESDETATAFARVGSELGSFYGCAYLLSGWRFSRGILSMNAFSSDQSPLPSGSRWIGIPPGNPWLEWFGGAYLEAAPESAPATSTRHARGILVRHALAPSRGDDELHAGWAVREEYLARREDPRFLGVPPSAPAVVLLPPEVGRRTD